MNHHIEPSFKESVALTVCDDSHDVANYLLQKILKHQPTFKKPNINEWSKEIDRAFRIDGRSKEELIRCIDWIYSTPKGSFWISNILSGKKLREKFDTMKMQASQQHPTQQKNLSQEWSKYHESKTRIYQSNHASLKTRSEYLHYGRN